MAVKVASKFSRDQLLQAFQIANPQINVNQQIPPQQLKNALNQMSLRSSDKPYDDETFEELVERVNSNQGILTVANYIDTHILAADILMFRKAQWDANQQKLEEFLQKLQNRINELKVQSQSNNESSNEGICVVFKQFFIEEQIYSNNVNIRIFNERTDQTLPFTNQGGYQSIVQQEQKVALDGLDQIFELEIFDENTNYTYGYVALNLFELNISNPQRISLLLTKDLLPTTYHLEIEGYVSVDNLQNAQEDLIILQQIQIILSEDLIGFNEQLNGLNSPFTGLNGVLSSVNHSLNQSYSAANNQNCISQDIKLQQQEQQIQTYLYNQFGQEKTSPNIAIVQPNQSKEDSDLSTQTLVSIIHYLLLGYIVAAIFLCLKRQMFLDVSIGISLLSVLIKFNLQSHYIGQIISEFFRGLFIFSAMTDLVWLSVFFPSWKKDISSEDQGAQEVIRILILGLSFLFLFYKVVMIIAVMDLLDTVQTKGYEIQKTVVFFFDRISK